MNKPKEIRFCYRARFFFKIATNLGVLWLTFFFCCKKMIRYMIILTYVIRQEPPGGEGCVPV